MRDFSDQGKENMRPPKTSASRAPRDVAPGEKMPGAINMGLADGHTELVKLEDLWKYYWHLDWQPPATRPQ